MNEKQKRKKIHDYFTRKKSGFAWPVILIFAGIFAFAVGASEDDSLLCVGAGLVLFGGFLGAMELMKRASLPSDHQIDQWLYEDLKEISKHALQKLDLSTELLTTEEPLRVLGPILWSISGIADKELLWKKGKDEYVRFSVYSVVLIYTAEYLLAAYECDYNMLKNVTLNENTYEFHYQDIVSVTTHETSTSYTLPNNEKMVVGQEFKVSVPGESINVIIDSQALFKITKGDMYYKDEVEKTVQRLRNLLRDKKQSASQPIPTSPPAYTAPPPSMPSVPETPEQGFQAPPPTDDNATQPGISTEQPPDSGVHFCSNCGRQVQPEERFCSNCGNQLRS